MSPTEFPQTLRDSLRDGDQTIISQQKRAMGKMHSAQGEVTDRAHSKNFFAGDTECAFRCTHSGTNLGQVQWRVGVRFQEFFKTRDDPVVAMTAGGHL